MKLPWARRPWRKWLMILTILIVGVPLCASFVLVHTQWGRDRIRDAAIEAIQTELGLRATMRNVQVDLVPTPTVSARGIVLDDPVYGRFAEADGLTIRPSLWAFMSGRIDLQTIEIDGPVVHLILREGEIRNLPRVRGASSPDDELPFKRLVVHGARVTLDADPFGTASLEGVNVELDVTDGTELGIHATAVSGRFDHIRGSERLQRFEARAHLGDGGIDLEQLVIWTPFLKIQSGGGFIPIPFDHDYHGQVRIRLNLAHLRDLPHGWEIPDIAGTLELDGELLGTSGGPAGSGRVTLEGGRIEQWGFGDVDLRVEADPSAIRITEGTAHLIHDGGEVDLSGRISLADPGTPLELRIGIRGLQFATLMEQLGVTPNTIVQWTMDGTAELHGTTAPLALRGPIHMDTRDFLVTRDAWHVQPSRRVVGVTRARIVGGVSVRPDGLRFDHLVADTPSSRIQADVLLGFDDTLHVSADSGTIDLRDASPVVDFPIGGLGRVSVEVTGTFQDPVLVSRLNLGDFAFDTFPLGDIETEARLESDGLAVRFPHVVAIKNESRYAIDNLLLDFTNRRFAASGSLQLSRMALADFFHVFHYEEDERFTDYQGVVQGSAEIRYTLGYPGDSDTGTMVTDLALSIPEANINGFAFTDGELQGRWRWVHYEQGYRGGELTLSHLHLRKGPGVVTVAGTMAQGGDLQMTAAADRIAVRDTEGLAERLPDLGGIYSIFADIRGTAEIPRVDMNVNVTGLSWHNALLGDASAYVRLTDRLDPWVRAAESWDPGNLPANEPCSAARAGFLRGRWNPDPPMRTVEGPLPALTRPMAFLVCGRGLNGQVAVDMAIGRTKVYPLRGVVRVADLVLGPFLRSFESPEPFSGSLSAMVSLAGGALLEDDSLVGRIQVADLRLGQGRVDLRNDGEIDVRLDRGDFRVAHATLVGPSSELSISGGGSSRGGLALELNGAIDLGLLATLSPRFTQADGTVSLRVNVSGRIEAPAIYGRAQVRHGSFRFAGFPEPLEDLNGQISFSARRVLFEGFRARIAGGELALAGAATLRGRGVDRYEFDIDAEGLSIQPEPGIAVELGGRFELDYASTQRLPLLHGTVHLGRVLYTSSIDVAQTLSLGAISRRQRAEVEQYDPAVDRIELDLVVVDDRPMRIVNNLIDAEVRIEGSERPFRIVGTDQRIGATGSLIIPRGTVRFREAEFEVRRGVISFDDELRVDPNFDVTAVTELRRSGDLTGPTWRIRLHAHGNADSFRLDTSSEPPLSQEDVMLLLTVGMTRAEMQQLQTGDITSTGALEALVTVTGIDREVRRAVPVIDDFALSSRYSPRTNRTEPQISIGKRIADRVRLTASTALSETREFRTGVEWRLSDQTSVEAVYDNVNNTTASSVGNIGVDVRWRLEFE